MQIIYKENFLFRFTQAQYIRYKYKGNRGLTKD